MISPHWIPNHRGGLGDWTDAQVFALWGPGFVKLVCVDERPPYLGDIPAAAKIVVRNHPMSENWGNREMAAGNFAAEGVAHAEVCWRMADYCVDQGIARERLLFEGLNEPQVWSGEPPGAVAVYYQSFLVALHTKGLHGVIGNFGVGWPGNGGVQDAPVDWVFFQPVIDIMQAGDYLGLHEYWAVEGGPERNWRWWAGRFLQCPFDVPILMTECGIDNGVVGNHYTGWQALPGTFEEKASRYIDELWRYATQCAADGRVQAIFPFTYDIGGAEWETFDVRNQSWVQALLDRKAAEGFPQPGAPPITPEPEPSATDELIREAAWNALGIAYNPEAALARYAREHGLGVPMTPEMDVAGQRAQGFALKIVACPIGQWESIVALNW